MKYIYKIAILVSHFGSSFFCLQSAGNIDLPISGGSQEFIVSTRTCSSNTSDSVYIIPIVFHVLYHDPVDNISDAQIADGLQDLNERFRKQNADTIDIIAPFVPIAADARIEFRLAQIDPYGNPTNGITHTYTDSTAFDFLWDAYYDSTGGTHTWPTNRYLNIHVVKGFAGIIGGGRGTLPSDMFPERQGIIITNNMVGAIGTGTGGTVFTHEMGHFLNLYHLWAYLGIPGDTTNCANDDEVTDTPNCFGASYYYGTPSGLWAESCGSLDNVQNYMDYSPSQIRNMFTTGQAARMHDALESPVGGRNNLHTEANQIATGIFVPNSIKETNNNQFVIYPNPASENLHISSSREALKIVQVFHVSGKEVLNLTDLDGFQTTINVGHLRPGVYIIKINHSHTQRLIIR
ncbi:MAG: zinc-dependent metalloprotease [Bacteroidales bacterium]|nr:zinc-dependent metalloprotease [Bacteroidales bacterium]MCF8458902.1 zinc-dependent metalloprotease [Bacteroidales bacterium]